MSYSSFAAAIKKKEKKNILIKAGEAKFNENVSFSPTKAEHILINI